MTPLEIQAHLIKSICKGNLEAEQFLAAWSAYVHGIDDLVDETTTNEFKIKLFIQALDLYNQPFYLKNRERLNGLIISCTNLYADSVAWEKSGVTWQKTFADWARHAGVEMVLQIACIVGGYDHMRAISLELRTINYVEHHNEKGEMT